MLTQVAGPGHYSAAERSKARDLLEVAFGAEQIEREEKAHDWRELQGFRDLGFSRMRKWLRDNPEIADSEAEPESEPVAGSD